MNPADALTSREPVVMVGGRTAVVTSPVVGSVMAECNDCKQDVWLAPDSVEVITIRIRNGVAGADKVNCVECMFVALEKEGVL